MTSTAKAVVTVQELLTEAGTRNRIRLGARVASEEIRYRSSPDRQVLFSVRDIEGSDQQTVPVIFAGNMPDTLKRGRDVILEGDYDGSTFQASSLMTQCPSKYEPPVPGDSYKPQAGSYSRASLKDNG